jgi:CRP-like cAMP-binding protein
MRLRIMMEAENIEDIARRLEDRHLAGIPNIILRLLLFVATNRKLSQAAIDIFAHFALNAIGTGYIATGIAPEVIAAKLGINRATVFRAYAALEEAGYIGWNRADARERSVAVTGRVWIIVPGIPDVP